MEVIAEEVENNSFLEADSTSPSQLESIVFDAEETSDSPLSELLQSRQAGPGSGGMSGRTVKQYEEEMRVLKKENFNLKLRIYFLEERMQKLGRPLGDSDGAEKKLIELKVQMETLRREMKGKQALLAQAGKAIEMMEEQHKAELQKLRRELASRPAAENSMALYADAFDLPASFLMPPPAVPAAARSRPAAEAELAELQQRLRDLGQELEASQERERRLNDALDSRTPEIQIKIEELCQKDKLLEDQRKIIVEIQIKLDEKQKELEQLRHSLDTQHSAMERVEADNQQLKQRLADADEKLEKSVKVVQTLVSRNQELAARAAGADQLGAMQHDEAEHLWRELEERRRQVEQLSREKAQLEAGTRLPPEVGLMLARLDELAAFLAALLRRPHLLATFSAANRSSLLQLLDQSRSLDASALSAPDESLLDHIHKFLDAPEHTEFLNEMESQLERTTSDLCAVSVSEELDSGKEMELARWSLEKGRGASKPARPPRKHELEQDEEEQPNLSESEAWSEPDRTVSLARIGLPENKTPVNQTASSPNSSELEHSPRTPGKKASYKKLVQRLHATEQINEALHAELAAHKALAKAASQHQQGESEVLQELEVQRARLEKLVCQSEASRQQLEVVGDEASAGRPESERLLAEAEGRVRQLEAELSERDALQRHLQLVQLETQEALAKVEAARAAMQDEVVQTRLACQQLERRALEATAKCQRLENASRQDVQRCQQLVKQVEEAEVQCRALTQQVQQLEAARASDSDEHSASRHTLSSPDLGIESDTGRSGGGAGAGDERSRLNQENWQLKQKLAESQRIMERCLEALNKKNRDRLRVQASMEKQLLRTEEVLLKASHNLKLLPKSP